MQMFAKWPDIVLETKIPKGICANIAKNDQYLIIFNGIDITYSWKIAENKNTAHEAWKLVYPR